MRTFFRSLFQAVTGSIALIVFSVLLTPSTNAKGKNHQDDTGKNEWLGMGANICRAEPSSDKLFVFNHYIYRSHCNTTEDITVEIGGIGLKVPRGSSSFQAKFDPRVIHHPDKECSIINALGLTRLDIGGSSGLTLTPSVPSSSEKRSSAYPRLDTNIKRWGKPERSCLTNGTMRLWWKAAGIEWYFLPIEKNPTADQRPVALICDSDAKMVGATCGVAYYHPDGLHFSYNFLRKRVPEDEFVAYDLHWRKVYEHMLVKETSDAPRNDPFPPVVNISE